MTRRLILLLLLTVCGLAPGTTAFAFDEHDWRAERKGLFGHRWICLSPRCGTHAAVSYEAQVFFPVYTLLDFETHWRKRGHKNPNVPQAITQLGLFRRINSYDESDGDLRHYTVIMRHREPNGAIDYVAGGYMARGLQAYDLLSLAPTADQAEANLQLLVEEVKPLLAR